MLKSHGCGELRETHTGADVALAGWVHRRRDHGGLVFLDLRDSTGLVQVVVHPDEAPAAFRTVEGVRNEYVLRIEGTVRARLDGTANVDLATGAIEVQARTLEVLNASETPPFPVNQDTNVDEATRLRYRYLDLRRERMASNLRLRHRVVKFIRDYLSEREFVEVETPVLNLATPEGARDYLVPSRVHPGHFYALPQSPQQWKQLLMVAGIDRYFQIARCFRDEDLRGDRQPEFTQLDLEMAFVEQDDVLALIEDLYSKLVPAVTPDFTVPSPFPRIRYVEAMERFGSDKPDLRYGLEIADLTAAVAGTDFQVFANAVAAGGRVRGLAVPGGASTPRREIDRLVELAKSNGAGGLVWVSLDGAGPLESLTVEDVRSPAARFLGVEVVTELFRHTGGQRGDLLLIAADRDEVTSKVLDALRRQLAEDLGLADPSVLAFAFVTEFPLFEWDAGEERWSAVHHLFTSPFEEDLPLFETDPGAVRSNAYDLICNGWELASGSIRIHRRDVQLKVLERLGMTIADAEVKFGHMLTAFTYGAPPHGGIAPGIDRTVALLAGERDIREVIAFPKTKTASDVLTGAPSVVDARQLADVHVDLAESARAELARLASTEG
ncbi:MAG: aspartate--tRNA ligase [Dehalococcoidia bacterium]|nr:aspartate--tRNA ligase [Dehalococcoidia bacterium]